MFHSFNPLKVIQPAKILLFGLTLLAVPSAGVGQEATKVVNSIETIINDMEKPHEGRPRGVPDTYSWAKGPRVEMGNHAVNFHSLIAWGQLYEDVVGNPAVNTRVQVRDMVTYILSKKDGQWHRVQNSVRVEGAAFREDYADDINRPADIRVEPDGSISVTAGGGYNFHFWPASGRISIDPNDIAGIFTTVQARLILNDLTKPDDRAIARYLLSVGADYWNDLDSKWNYFKTSSDVGIGRFKYVTNEWQSFNMATVSPRNTHFPSISASDFSIKASVGNAQAVPEPSLIPGLLGMGMLVTWKCKLKALRK